MATSGDMTWRTPKTSQMAKVQMTRFDTAPPLAMKAVTRYDTVWHGPTFREHKKK